MAGAQSGWRNANGGGSKPSGTQNLSEVLVEGNNTGNTPIEVKAFDSFSLSGSKINFLNSSGDPHSNIFVDASGFRIESVSNYVFNASAFQVSSLSSDGTKFYGYLTDFASVKYGVGVGGGFNIVAVHNTQYNNVNVDIGNTMISSRASKFGANSYNSLIIGGQTNEIVAGVNRSVVIGGSSLVASESDTVYAPRIFLQEYAKSVTGTVIDFTRPKIFGTDTTPETGNFTNNLTNARVGVVQKIYHNHTSAPTFPAGWVLMGNSAYVPNEVNIIYAEWSEGTRVEYWIVQEN